MIHGLLTGFGVSTASGLNATIPLLATGLLARWTHLVQLHAPYDKLTHPWVLIGLAVLAVLEFFGDKIPVADHAMHALGLVVHPTAGAVAYLAVTSSSEDRSALVVSVVGVLLSGAVHLGRAAVRPIVTALTAGTGNWLISLVEDVLALILAVLAVVAPILALVFIGLVGYFVVRMGRRTLRWLGRKRLRPPPLPDRRPLVPPPLPSRRR